MQNRRNVALVLLQASFLTLATGQALAQNDPAGADSPHRLGEVLVTSERAAEKVVSGPAAKSVAEYPGAVTVVGEQEIEELRPLSTIDVLQQVPGVNVTTEDGRGLRPNIGLRGINPDRSREGVLILADGVPIQPAVYGDKSAYYNVPVELVERIEVIRGASSVLYGPGNVGGVVNFITKRPPSEPGRTFQLTETIRQGALFDSLLSFGVTGESGIGTRISYLNKYGETVRENTDVHLNDFNVRTIVPTAENGELAFRFNYFQENSDTPGGLPPELFKQDPDQSIRSEDVFHGERVGMDVSFVQPLADDLVLDTLLYANHFRRDWYIADGADGVAETNTQFLRDFTVVGIEPRIRYGKWLVGTRLHSEQLDDVNRKGDTAGARTGTTQSDTDLSTVAWASYIQRDIELFDGFVLTPGVRYEYIDQEREQALKIDPELGPVQGGVGGAITKEVVGGVNFNYEPLAGHHLYGGIQRSFEPPAFSEAIDPTTGTDNDLDSETAITYELGYRTRLNDWLSADTTLFLLDFEDKIINEAGILSNAGETRHKGIEFGLIADPLEQVRANLSVTLLDTEFRNGSNAGNDLPMAPEARLAWGVSYQVIDPLTVRLDGHFVDEQFTDAANTVEESEDGGTGRLPSYDVWNLRADYRLPEVEFADGVRLFAGVANLFDEEYRERRQASFNGIIPGLTRTFYGGVEVTF